MAGDGRAGEDGRMPVIEVTGLHKEYGPTVAVDDVSFGVEAGEIFGILGPNGAGKTTTVECVTGLRRPDRGRISVLGLDPQRDHDELREQVGVQLQDGQLPDKIRVHEALELYASFYPHPVDAGELITRLGLGDRSPSSGSTTGPRPWPSASSGACCHGPPTDPHPGHRPAAAPRV